MMQKEKRHFDKNNIKREKIRLIFLPFFVVALGVIALCTVIYWYLGNESGIAELGSIGFYVVLLPMAAFLLLIRRFTLIERDKEYFQRALWIGVLLTAFVPSMFLQTYVDGNPRSIVYLESISEINDTISSRFYTIAQRYQDTEAMRHFTYIEDIGEGRSFKKRRLETYCVIPVYDSPILYIFKDNPKPVAWIGKMYRSKDFFPEEQTKVLSDFVGECRIKFHVDARKQFEYFERINYTDKSGYYLALKREHLPEKPIILVAHNEPFEERAGNSLNWALFAFGIGAAVELILILVVPFNEKRLHYYIAGKAYWKSYLPKPSDIKKGKKKGNDKLIVVRGEPIEKLKKELTEVCKLYNGDMGQMYPCLSQVGDQEFIITFPYDIDFELFCYLINYICYPLKATGTMPEVVGWTKAADGNGWIKKDIAGQNIMIYVPKDDTEHDNVFITTEKGKCYKFDFDGTTIAQREVIEPYRQPDFNVRSLPTEISHEQFS